jgi:hypothetical protein
MAWRDFQASRKMAYGKTLLKLQKRFIGLIAGKGSRYHADLLLLLLLFARSSAGTLENPSRAPRSGKPTSPTPRKRRLWRETGKGRDQRGEVIEGAV